MSWKEGRGGRFWVPFARARISIPCLSHQANVSSSCSAKRSLESSHSFGGRSEPDDPCNRGRLFAPVGTMALNLLAGNVAYFDCESVL